jgi:hypothetical protein
MRRQFARTVAAALAGLLGTAAAAAQTTGSIEGIVRDATGGVLTSVDVLVSSPYLQGARAVKTDRDGRFWLPALPPGKYAVTAALAGFHPVTRPITVSLDAKSTIDFALEPAVKEAISVSGEAPPIDMTSTTGGTNYTSAVIAHLPVDRNYADIVRANPAVDTDRGDTQGRSVALTIYGATSAENQWIVDGVNTTNVFMGQQGKSINNEFVQEVEVKTDGYAAEYGRALGGVVNVITKSGGNNFRGDAFLYYDTSGTSARRVYTGEDQLVGESRLTDYSRLDFGADLGGFIVKDRLWFFAAYDRINFTGHVSPLAKTPYVTTAERFPLDEGDNLYSAKLTWNVAPQTTLVASVFADPSATSGAAGADPRLGPSGRVVEPPTILNRDPSTWDSTRVLGGTDYGLRATQLLGATGLLTFQASYHQDRNLLSAKNLVRTEDLTCADGTPTEPCTFPSVPNFATGGHGWIDGQKDHNLSHRAQFRGDFTLYADAHELKAGADYADAHSDMTYALSGGQLVQVLNERGRTYYVHEYSAVSETHLTQLADGRFRANLREIGAYAQDSWKPAAGLTINAGLRWDGEYLQDYQGVTRLSLTNQWQPRLGIVWDPWHDGRTKVYASAGRFDFAMPTVAMTWWFANVTGVDSYNFDPLSLTPDPSVVPFAPAFDDKLPEQQARGYLTFYGGGPQGTPADRGIREMYQDELTAGVERLLDPTFTVGLKASYRRLGNGLEDRCDFLDADGNSYCAIINPGSGETYARGAAPNCEEQAPDFCPGDPVSPPARRLYRGIELLARKSFGKSAWLQASYVYSSLHGNYDGAINEQNAGPVPGRNTDFDASALWYNAYGRLFLDRPHRFRFDGYWITPLRLSVGLQAYVASGAPLDKLGYFDPYQTPLIYLVPRGSAGRMPTQWEANLTLGYPITLGPAIVTLQAYVYNLFNNQIPLTRNNDWTISANDSYSSFDPNRPSNNEDFGQFTSRQAPRVFRAAVRVSF